MSRFPIQSISATERQRLVRDVVKLRANTTAIEQQIDRERRIVFYRNGFEITDAQLLALHESAMYALHARMQTLQELRETFAGTCTVDIRSLTGPPTRRKCSCCDEPIFNQYNRCAGGSHCVCPLCYIDLRMNAPAARQCLRCHEADKDVFSPVYDIEPNAKSTDFNDMASQGSGGLK